MNKNYLGHDFSLQPFYNKSWYQCSICNINIYHEEGLIYSTKDGTAMLRSICEISCEEMMIKNIIE